MSIEARSFELSKELADKLETAADQRSRPVGELLEAAVRRFLDDEAALAAKIEAARANAAAGATVSWDEAERGFRETIARTATRRTSA